MPYRVSREHFEGLADKALRSIPKKYRKYFRNIVILVEDFPDREVMDETGIPRDELLGLFRGQSYEEKDAFFTIPSPYPDTIHLYQRNIEEVAENEDHLFDEIRMTMLHEVGHYFGMTEEDLEEFEDG